MRERETFKMELAEQLRVHRRQDDPLLPKLFIHSTLSLTAQLPPFSQLPFKPSKTAYVFVQDHFREHDGLLCSRILVGSMPILQTCRGRRLDTTSADRYWLVCAPPPTTTTTTMAPSAVLFLGDACGSGHQPVGASVPCSVWLFPI